MLQTGGGRLPRLLTWGFLVLLARHEQHWEERRVLTLPERRLPFPWLHRLSPAFRGGQDLRASLASPLFWALGPFFSSPRLELPQAHTLALSLHMASKEPFD